MCITLNLKLLFESNTLHMKNQFTFKSQQRLKTERKKDLHPLDRNNVWRLSGYNEKLFKVNPKPNSHQTKKFH